MAKKTTHRREVTISVALPCAVTVVVESEDATPDEHTDWQILHVKRAHVETTPRALGEHMREEDFEAMVAAAAMAKDLP